MKTLPLTPLTFLRRLRLTLLILTIQILAGKVVLGQTKIAAKDSIDVKTQIEGFYTWYIDIGKKNLLSKEFDPSFVRRDDGMTTLDFKKYENRLKRFGFSDIFIARKINDYKICIDNLNKISFDKFSQLKDLDDFEDISCDFGNRYEWTGGMERKDAANLVKLRRVDKTTIIGQVDFTSYGKADGTTAMVTFRRNKKAWLIDDLKLE